jgi:hypothetical protein
MNLCIGELLELAYQFYPRGVWDIDPRYKTTEEHSRLVTARHRAGAEEAPWRAMLRRLAARFPECTIQNRSLHLPSGDCDACYSAWLNLPTRGPGERDHDLGILVSFLVPCYVVYISRSIYVDPPGKEAEISVRQVVDFDLSPDEQTYARVVVDEIAATFGDHYEPMPPEIGNVVVPDVVAGNKVIGEATLFHCLFTDNW